MTDPNIQKIIDAADKLDEVVSVEVKEVPPHLLSQVGEGNYTYFVFKLKVDNDCIVEAGFIIPQQILEQGTVQSFIDGIKDLAECGCTRVGEPGDVYCVDNPFYNRGKATYLIRYPDMYQVKLEDEQPELIIIPREEMVSMVDKLKKIDKVKEVVLEKIIDERLIAENGSDAIMVSASIDVDANKTIDHWVSFVAPKEVWESEIGHGWAVESLQKLVDLNNA